MYLSPQNLELGYSVGAVARTSFQFPVNQKPETENRSRQITKFNSWSKGYTLRVRPGK
jgi:hypothetical protein